MTSELERLINTSIEKAIKVHDYTQVYFDNKSILNINNNYNIHPDVNLSDLAGNKVLKVNENDKEISLILDDDLKIVIDMSDEGWNSEEAIELLIDGDPMPIVWN